MFQVTTANDYHTTLTDKITKWKTGIDTTPVAENNGTTTISYTIYNGPIWTLSLNVISNSTYTTVAESHFCLTPTLQTQSNNVHNPCERSTVPTCIAIIFSGVFEQFFWSNITHVRATNGNRRQWQFTAQHWASTPRMLFMSTYVCRQCFDRARRTLQQCKPKTQ